MTTVEAIETKLLERKSFFAVVSCFHAESDQECISDPDIISLFDQLGDALHIPRTTRIHAQKREFFREINDLYDDIPGSLLEATLPHKKKENPKKRKEIHLRPGTILDCKDCSGEWLEGVVRDIDGDQVRVHYLGWNNRFDEWIDISSKDRLAPKGTLSKKRKAK